MNMTMMMMNYQESLGDSGQQNVFRADPSAVADSHISTAFLLPPKIVMSRDVSS